MIILLNSEKCDRCYRPPQVVCEDYDGVKIVMEDNSVLLTEMFDGTRLCKKCYDAWNKERRRIYELNEHDLFRKFCKPLHTLLETDAVLDCSNSPYLWWGS